MAKMVVVKTTKELLVAGNKAMPSRIMTVAVHDVERGFTLIEILIVLVIVAIMAAVTVLNIKVPSHSNFIAQARKAAVSLEVINDEAIYTNSVIVCGVSATDGLECSSYKNGEWTDVNLGKLVPWGWPDKINIQEVRINDALLKNGEMLRFLPTGNLNTIDIKISDGRYTTWLNGNLDGNFEVSN